MTNKRYKLQFHLMPPAGWMNDPNGLCFYQGLYHVFFQYAPSGPCNYERYWGHYTSPDMIHWKYEGIAVKSDCAWDCNGAFSGCAFTDDGIMELFYTGNVEAEGDYDYIHEGRGANVIYLQSTDGFHFSPKKLLLTNEDYPIDYTCHVRDPKVWKERNTYHMVLGGRKQDDTGAILHYISEDKMRWKLEEEITSYENFGFMWECPDMFILGGQTVLMCCPQGVKREEYYFQNVHQAGYWIMPDATGKADSTECRDDAMCIAESSEGVRQQFLRAREFQELDKGFDFYAPQSFLAPDGRRILYGWGGVSEMDKEYRNDPIIEEGWQHSLTVPRELKLFDGIIRQYPIKELEMLRYDAQKLQNGVTEVNTDAFDLEFTFKNKECMKVLNEADKEFQIQDTDIKTRNDIIEIQFSEDVRLLWENGICTLHFLNDSGCGRSRRKAVIKELHHLRILKDVSMLEIYINGGEYVFTARYFPKDVMRTTLRIKGCYKAMLWAMKPMTVDLSKTE